MLVGIILADPIPVPAAPANPSLSALLGTLITALATIAVTWITYRKMGSTPGDTGKTPPEEVSVNLPGGVTSIDTRTHHPGTVAALVELAPVISSLTNRLEKLEQEYHRDMRGMERHYHRDIDALKQGVEDGIYPPWPEQPRYYW